MRQIFEVTECDFHVTKSKLLEYFLDAENDFRLKVNNFVSKSTLVTDPEILKVYRVKDSVTISDNNFNPSVLKNANIYYYRTVPELEGYPSYTKEELFQIEIKKRELY